MRAAARRPVAQTDEERRTESCWRSWAPRAARGRLRWPAILPWRWPRNRSKKTLLIDLDLPLGDAALNLGIMAEFSAIDALQAADRLDARFLSQLLVKHSSGVWVLAAPGKFVQYQASDEAIDWLLTVARQEFDNVVVDMGSKLDLMGTAAYKEATTVYLVTQASIPELRNSNRLDLAVFRRQPCRSWRS